MYELGIVSGYDDGEYKPSKLLTNFEAITIAVRCLGYENTETEREAYPEKYIEIAEKLDLLNNTNIKKDKDEEIINGDLYVLVLNTLKTKVNDKDYKLMEYGRNSEKYKIVSGIVKSVNESNIMVENAKLVWLHKENLATYIGKSVEVWCTNDGENSTVIELIVQ